MVKVYFSLLPNLPKAHSHTVDILDKFLAYPPEQRLSAKDALVHPWIVGNSDDPLILPQNYPVEGPAVGYIKREDLTERLVSMLGLSIDSE